MHTRNILAQTISIYFELLHGYGVLKSVHFSVHPVHQLMYRRASCRRAMYTVSQQELISR